MAWKIEKWIEDIFPGEDKIDSQYENIAVREFIIIVSASLDLALVQLLNSRLIENIKEEEDFLGLNGDGRAPCGTFGTRIQLSLLVGIISQEDAEVLRVIKSLRNLYAHSINVSLLDGDGLKLINKLFEKYKKIVRRLRGTEDSKILIEKYNKIESWFSKDEQISKSIINSVYLIYQIYFHRQYKRIDRIEKQKNMDLSIVQGHSENI